VALLVSPAYAGQLVVLAVLTIGAIRLLLLTESRLYNPVRESADNFVKVLAFAFLLMFALWPEFSLGTAPTAAFLGFGAFVFMEAFKANLSKVFVLEALAMVLLVP